jgi:OOP family OmpA-OmpF porin
MTGLFAVVATVVFTVTATAHAANGLYAGVSAGPSRFAESCEDIVGTCDDVGTGWKLYGGHQFTPYAGIEAAYVDLGKTTGTDTSFGPPIDVEAEVSGVNIALVGTAPVAGPFAFQGKVGFFLSSLDIRASGGASGSDSASSVGLAIGLGAKLSFTESVYARAEWERFMDIGDDDTGKDDVDLISFGLGVAF